MKTTTSNSSTKTKSLSLATDNKLKTLFIVIIVGAILSSAAPFLHMLFPIHSTEIVQLKKLYEQNLVDEQTYTNQLNILKQKQAFVGFPNFRTFLYNIGKPITLLYFSLLLIGIYPFITEIYIRKAAKFSSTILGFVSFYFTIWVFWYRGDLPKFTYYTAIGVIAILSTFLAIALINHRKNLLLKIQQLIEFIVVDTRNKYIPKEKETAYVEDVFHTLDKVNKIGK